MSSKQTKSPKKSVQTVIQINVYRYKDGKPQFLMLKRLDKDNDHFWQPISQPIGHDDDLEEALVNVTRDQVGVADLTYLSNELYKYEWYSDGQQGRDIIFAGEVDPHTLVFPDLTQFDTFAWMPYKEALLKLKWDGNKQSLRQLMDHLEAREANGGHEAAAISKATSREATKEISKDPAPTDQPEQQTGNQTHIVPETSSATRQSLKVALDSSNAHRIAHILSAEPKPVDDDPHHRPNSDLSDELMPNYKNEDGDESNSVFPL